MRCERSSFFFFFFQAEDGIRDFHVTGVQTCAFRSLVAHGGKQVACLTERLLCFGPAESSQAATLAKEGESSFGNVPELLPPDGRFGIEGCRVGVLTGVLGELRAGSAERVLVERVPGLESVGEPLGEGGVARGERGSYHRGQLSRVVRRLSGARYLLELGEQGGCPLGLLHRERGGGRTEGDDDHLGGAERPAGLDQPVDSETNFFALAAREAVRKLDGAVLEQDEIVAACLGYGGELAGARKRLLGAAELCQQGGAVGVEHTRRLDEAALLAKGDPLLEVGQCAGWSPEGIAGDCEVVLHDSGVPPYALLDE